MKKIYFIRHAKSAWDNHLLKDIERPLNSRGMRDASFMAKLLFKTDNNINGIIKSPAKRISETAAEFIKIYGFDANQIVTENSIYHGGVDDILEAMHNAKSNWETIMIFGHNPSMTYIANYFGSHDIYNVSTCGIVVVESKANEWSSVSDLNSSVIGYYYPKQYLSE